VRKMVEFTAVCGIIRIIASKNKETGSLSPYSDRLPV